MVRKFVTATVSAALCVSSLLPGVAAAQEHRFTGFDAPRGATATVNLRVPFGVRQQARRTTYGLTLGYGQTVAPDINGVTRTRAINVADFRFNGNELRQARVASVDFANLDQSRRRMNMTGGEDATLWIVVGVVAAGAVACFVIWDCFGDDDDDLDD